MTNNGYDIYLSLIHVADTNRRKMTIKMRHGRKWQEIEVRHMCVCVSSRRNSFWNTLLYWFIILCDVCIYAIARGAFFPY